MKYIYICVLALLLVSCATTPQQTVTKGDCSPIVNETTGDVTIKCQEGGKKTRNWLLVATGIVISILLLTKSNSSSDDGISNVDVGGG